MQKRFCTLEIRKGKLNFSAGHFTIFSATERENLHGHNYELEASFTAELHDTGLTFDYRIFDDKLKSICEELNLRFLLPKFSPYLSIAEDSDYYIAEFNKQKLFFLKTDALILPLANITLEELSQWFITRITENIDFLNAHKICKMWIKVFNGTEHCAKAKWTLNL
jgi:6-pyruvoyltetrahydropterin/6-carboxytetrahydropterin synthase